MNDSGLQMSDRIKNTDELEFAIFCIENLAIRLKTNAEHIYTALAESSSFLYDYIVAHYDVLHTQDKEYIINDILEAMDQCGIKV